MDGGHSFDSRSFKQAWQHGAELQHTIEDLLKKHSLSSREFLAGMDELQRQHGDVICAELFFHLCRLKLDYAKARAHWDALRSMHDRMSSRLREPIDLRVALVNYFTSQPSGLSKPLIIDVSQFEALHEILMTDDLTGLHNYRYLSHQLEHEVRRAEQCGYTFSIIAVDVDDFRLYNDRHGDVAGNDVLVQLGRVLRTQQRATDLVVRSGGDEFTLLCPATSKNAGLEIAQGVLEKLRSTAFPKGRSQPQGRLTVSMGVATYPADATSAQELTRRADAAMYAAKRAGKDQVHLYGDNRRSHNRVSMTLRGQLSIAAEERGVRFETQDISEGGLLVLTDTKLPIGSLIDVRLQLREGDSPVSCPGRVVRSVPSKDGGFAAGVHFIAPDTDDHRKLVAYVREGKAAASGSP